MTQITIAAGDTSATIDAGVGAGLLDFSIPGPAGSGFRFPLLRRAPLGPAAAGEQSSFLLTPWSNRIARAELAFRGETHALTNKHDDGTALHGLGWTRAWSIEHRTPLSATLALRSADLPADDNHGWPFPFGTTARYEVAPGTLSIDLTLTNTGDSPMPAGLGFHPYFSRELWCTGEAVEVTAAVTGEHPAEACVVTGPADATPLSERFTAGGPLESAITRGELIDHCFAGFGGTATVRWPGSGVTCTLSASSGLGHFVVYCPRVDDNTRPGETAPAPYFCLEPVSHCNDAFNLMDAGHDWTGARVLAPGETMTETVRFETEASS